ncbi:MAG: hypothetical protein QOF86_3999 [Baekduia sp.]|nr:hypothetical protein [Baekduia sp.]
MSVQDRYQLVNRAFEQRFGLHEAWIIGRGDDEVMPADGARRDREAHATVLNRQARLDRTQPTEDSQQESLDQAQTGRDTHQEGIDEQRAVHELPAAEQPKAVGASKLHHDAQLRAAAARARAEAALLRAQAALARAEAMEKRLDR